MGATPVISIPVGLAPPSCCRGGECRLRHHRSDTMASRLPRQIAGPTLLPLPEAVKWDSLSDLAKAMARKQKSQRLDLGMGEPRMGSAVTMSPPTGTRCSAATCPCPAAPASSCRRPA